MINTARVKVTLEARLRQLQQRAEDIQEDLSARPDADWEVDALESEDDEVLASLGDLTLDDIRDVKLALNRIATGSYGICVACGERIVEARLRALPHTTRCIKCA